jgi:RNA polymerase sigma factor (sigma-70 family)
MADYRCEPIAELARQMGFTPPARRRRQIDRAEKLYWQLDPVQNYPLEFVIYHITGYRAGEQDESVLMVGRAVQDDLLKFVEEVGDTLNDSAEDYNPPAMDLPELCSQLNVSSKTISRYRRAGLFARRFVFAGGRKKLGFLPASVERFLESRPHQTQAASRFSRIDESTRHAILTRARRIAGRVDTSPYIVARHLAEKFGRSTETIRRLLVEHDRAHPRFAVFPDHTPPLTEKQQRVIHRAYHRGISVARLAEHFGKSRDAIYRAINHQRALAVRQLDISFIKSPTFDLPDAEQVILDPARPDVPVAAKAVDESPSTTPGHQAMDALPTYLSQLTPPAPPDRVTEQNLFARYNYLKYRAALLRDRLDKYHPAAGDLDRISTWLRRAAGIKQYLVQCYLRLVVSVARKHAASLGRSAGQSLIDLIGEGNLVLLDAIDQFDAGRGNRFSTYLTWALMRHFATQHNRDRSPTTVGMETGGSFYWPSALNPALAAIEQTEHVQHALATLLGELTDRERYIISRHYGLADETDRTADPQTLASISGELGISAERARQIEQRALVKLRRAARDLDLGEPAAPTADEPEESVQSDESPGEPDHHGE